MGDSNMRPKVKVCAFTNLDMGRLHVSHSLTVVTSSEAPRVLKYMYIIMVLLFQSDGPPGTFLQKLPDSLLGHLHGLGALYSHFSWLSAYHHAIIPYGIDVYVIYMGPVTVSTLNPQTSKWWLGTISNRFLGPFSYIQLADLHLDHVSIFRLVSWPLYIVALEVRKPI